VLDQRINDRGFAVDVELATAAVELSASEKAWLNERTLALTDGDVPAATQRDLLLAHILKAYGVALPDMRADTLQRRIDDENLPLELRQLLDLRVQSGRSTASKYKTLVNSVNDDGRLRGCLQFCGAPTTGRYSGRLFQPQNLARPSMSNPEIEEAIQLIKDGTAGLLYNNMPEVLGNCVRGSIIAPPGRKLIAADLKSIEGRGLAWLAGERDVVQFYRDFDAGVLKYDSYMQAYADTFGGDPALVTKYQRQIGKVIELACFGPYTKVVTNNGIKFITDVTLQDKLWDGVEWVHHQGLVARGVKPTVEINGVSVTQEHLFLAGKQWREAKQLASSASTLSLALATGLESLKSLASSMAMPVESASFLSVALAAQNRTLSMTTTCATAKAPGATLAPSSALSAPESVTVGTPMSSLMKRIAAVCSTVLPRASLAAIRRPLASGKTTAAGVSAFTLAGAKGLLGAGLSWLTSQDSKDGTVLSASSTASTTTKGTSQATFASSVEKKTWITGALSQLSNVASPNLKPVYDIAHAGPRNRFTILSDDGAFVVHNCGYGGGVAAFLTFAMTYHLDLVALAEHIWATGDQRELKDCAGKWEWAKENGYDAGMNQRMYAAFEYAKQRWRAARPKTVAMWAKLAEGFKQAVLYPDKTVFAGPVKFRRTGSWLRMMLPSGRQLCFVQPRADTKGLSYSGLDRYSRKWARVATHGGKLSGILTQAFASDILRHAMPKLEAAGFEIILTVHDEVVVETTPERTVEEVCALFTSPISWAPGLPLAADGFEATRYKKDS
jgi:hypothetical protein